MAVGASDRLMRPRIKGKDMAGGGRAAIFILMPFQFFLGTFFVCSNRFVCENFRGKPFVIILYFTRTAVQLYDCTTSRGSLNVGKFKVL